MVVSGQGQNRAAEYAPGGRTQPGPGRGRGIAVLSQNWRRARRYACHCRTAHAAAATPRTRLTAPTWGGAKVRTPMAATIRMARPKFTAPSATPVAMTERAMEVWTFEPSTSRAMLHFAAFAQTCRVPRRLRLELLHAHSGIGGGADPGAVYRRFAVHVDEHHRRRPGGYLAGQLSRRSGC